MELTLIKIITVMCVILELVVGTPLRHNGYEDIHPQTRAPTFFSPFLAPVKKAQQYFNSFGNLFAPGVSYPINNEKIPANRKEPIYNDIRQKPFTEVLTSSPKTTTKTTNYERTTIKNSIETVNIDKELIDKIFNDFKDIDQSITTTENTATEYTTGTGDCETTTETLLRIPAPVIASLLGG